MPFHAERNIQTIISNIDYNFVTAVARSGYNEYGQLGRGVTSAGLQRAQIIKGYAKFLDEAPELVKIVQVSCGEYHSAAISEKGEV